MFVPNYADFLVSANENIFSPQPMRVSISDIPGAFLDYFN